MTDLLAGLLPATVKVEQVAGDLDGRLLPGEEPPSGDLSASRRAELVTGRLCARAALRRLGRERTAVPRGVRGEPVWPPGVVGSLTHCAGLRAAAVAHAADVAGLGIDAELHQPLPVGVLDVVASPAEQHHLRALTDEDPGVAWDRLLFSAKESVYKVWSPATGRWLDFDQVAITLEATGTFTARLLVPGLVLAGRPVDLLNGRWAVRGAHAATAVAVTR